MTREEAAYGLGAEPSELEAALHQPPAADIETAACGLRMDQAAAAFHVLTSNRWAEVIVGPAGSGKTRVLAEIGKAWPSGRVVGITPSQSSRDVLAAAGVAPRAITSPGSSVTSKTAAAPLVPWNSPRAI